MTARSLRAWRQRLRLTQRQMAEALGISRSTWIRYEHGTAPAWVYLLVNCLRTTDESTKETTP